MSAEFDARQSQPEKDDGGWRSPLAVVANALLAVLTLSGLLILFAPFGLLNQLNVVLHTVGGLLFIVPCAWYVVRHWREYWHKPLSHIVVLGYLGLVVLVVCVVSGVVLTWQAAFGARISYAWDMVHIISTFAIVAFAAPHVVLLVIREWRASKKATGRAPRWAWSFAKGQLAAAGIFAALVIVGGFAFRPPALQREFPADYTFRYGEGRPFAPSLARTDDNRAIDPRVLSGSLSCGTANCHTEIVEEWEASAHRYSAMDAAFQKIQMNMAQQNGPETTRYCGGCHDPISLFSGAKNLFVETSKLTALEGYQEGVSCLVCHSIRTVDVKGNANYSIARPARYLFELEHALQPRPVTGFVRDFLIRAYPAQHMKDLSKKLFKTPEYCAACHKQFIDQEINNVGWVQLQNQYDNWRQSHWNKQGDPTKTIECRECHMPLVESKDPSSGDEADYNRSASDRKHRSHRFIASNQMMPMILKLPGWEEQVALTEKWLKGEYEIPEIAHKWRTGPVVKVEMVAPERVSPGEPVNLRLIVGSNKVGHDFPTGPLDIIQAWLQIRVTDEAGRVVYSKGSVDARGFIEPGTFMFKAEPVDQYGNLIDRHNLWEMVGVRYRRALFPGFTDFTEFSFRAPSGRQPVRLRAEAKLNYRKVDQYLVNFIFGEDSGLASPVVEMASVTREIVVAPGGSSTRPTTD